MTAHLGRRSRRAVSAISSLALVSVVFFAVPASAGGSGRLSHLGGSVIGAAAPAVPDNACPTRFEPTGGDHQVYTGTVVHQGQPEILTVTTCVVCCHPGGRDLTGTFLLQTQVGTLSGDADGNLCTCAFDIRFGMSLRITHGTRALSKTDGVLLFQGSFEGGFDTVDGVFTSNTTLTAGS
jgi:hypothetical protein